MQNNQDATDPAGTIADEGLRCPECGYNLTGLSAGTCPECGRKFDPAVLRKMRLIGYGPIPIWDERGRRGLLSAYLATAATFVFRQRSFLAALPKHPSGRSAWVFFAINLALAAACGVATIAYELSVRQGIGNAAFALGVWLVSSVVAVYLVADLLDDTPYRPATHRNDRRSHVVACLESVFLVPMGFAILALAIAAELRYRPAVTLAIAALHGSWITWMIHTAHAATRLTGRGSVGVSVFFLMPLVAAAALLAGTAAVVLVTLVGMTFAFLIFGVPMGLLGF